MKPVVGRRSLVVGESAFAAIPSHLATVTRLLAAALLLLSISCTSKPPLRVSISGNTAHVDVHTWGEYGTNIVHVRLENTRTHSTVWELKANSGKPVLGAFVLKEGENPALLHSPGGTYEIIIPAGSSAFTLDRGVEYELSFWKEPDSAPARAKFQFTH